MSFKTTFLMFGVLLGTLWLFGLTLSSKKGGGDEGYVLPSLHEDQDSTVVIDAVQIDRDGKKYEFARTAEGWRLNEPPSKQQARVDEFKVDRIIDQVKGARKNEEVDVTRDLAKFGLDKPRATVTLKKKGGGKEWTLNLGNESPDKGQYVYVSSSDRPRDVMAVRASTLDSVLFKDINELRSRTLLDFTELNAQAVQLKEPKSKDKGPVQVELKKTEQGGWRFEQPPLGAADFEGSTTGKQKREGVKTLLNDIAALRVESNDDFEPLGSTRPMKDYGLEEGQEKLRIQVSYTSGFGEQKTSPVHTLLIGDKVKDKDRYYARVEGEDSIVKLDAKKLEPIFKMVGDPKVLRSYDLAQVDPTAADAIDIARGKDVIRLRRPEPTLWKVFTGTDIPRKANVTAIEGEKGLVATLEGKRQIKEFFYAQGAEETKKLETKLGLDNPVAEIKVWVNSLVKEEPARIEKQDAKSKEAKKDKKEPEAEPKLKADAKPVVRLRFGKSDKGLVYVKRDTADGSTSWLAVPVAILQKVAPASGALAFLDLGVPGFDPDSVTRLELTRGPEKYEVVRDKEPKQAEWTLKEPKDLPGRTAADAGAVDQMLNLLGRLTAKKWVAKINPKDATSLKTFGLDRPALTVTVSVKKTGEEKGEPHVYKFGKDTDVAGDKPGIFALEGNSDLVFLVDPETVKTLREAELRDRTVFKFDPAKVKEVKLTSRKDGKADTALFQRNADTGAWILKSGPEDFNLNEDKVNDLVGLLADLHAQKYVSFKGPLKAEYKLGPMEAALQVEVLMEDGKTKHELTVGADKDMTGYYAQGNSLPGVVFLVSYPRFTPILGGVGYFGKEPAQ